ncbi:MAG: NAD(P)H-dependent glycerol-3-phosphate dehydrogenase [Myxococcales bacterium]
MTSNAPLQIAVLGAGDWGSTLALIAAGNGHHVGVWARSEARCTALERRAAQSPLLLGPERTGGSLHATLHPEPLLESADLVLMAVPSPAFREACRGLRAALEPRHLLIHGTKGLEVGSLKRMSEVLLEETCVRQFGALSGPNIAPELAQGKPAGSLIASPFPRVVELGKRALSCRFFMLFHGPDLLGLELCGALKNVVAIAAGMADAMQVGENAKALLITRGAAEIRRLAESMGAQPNTITGLAGIGDLMVTCASPHSRNRRLGAALARGESMENAQAQLGMVAEGVYAAKAIMVLSQRKELRLPLLQSIARVLYDGVAPQRALDALMRMPAGHEGAG